MPRPVKKAGPRHPKPPKKSTDAKRAPRLFPIVGVGASAGGMEAFSKLIEALPADCGLAIIFIQHLDPSHQSLLPQLLSRVTKLRVMEAEEGTQVQPDRIYVIPPNTSMAIKAGVLRLAPRSKEAGLHLPVNFFFNSLADDQKSRAVGIVLSGTASDGTEGLKAIKAAGGFTLAQDEASARFPGMPQSARASGVVDLVLPPEKIAVELLRLVRHPSYAAQFQPAESADEAPFTGGEGNLARIFDLLHQATGTDFSGYKPSTIRRRILRRMMLQNVEKLEAYIRYLRQDPKEVETLAQDMLIHVTSFFRDPQTFESLARNFLPSIFQGDRGTAPIRVWVPGCSTGEEAYSLAICLLEAAGDRVRNIQVFATDISAGALEKARSGIYSEQSMVNVSAQRLDRFFTRVDGNYQVNKRVREICLFAVHNVNSDPPFSRLDMVSCRNVLIYLSTPVQENVIRTFHYSLNPGGILMLGISESIGSSESLFKLADKRNRIYVRTGEESHFRMGPAAKVLGPKASDPRQQFPGHPGLDPVKEADRLILGRYAPAGVLLSENLEILQFRGDTAPFLGPVSGKASLNLQMMAGSDLVLTVRGMLKEARQKKTSVQKSGVAVESRGRWLTLSLEVVPVASDGRNRYYLVLFKEVLALPEKAGSPGKYEKALIKRLREQLAATRENLQTSVEEQEASNQELRSALEENQSSNEELQSTNEELETAREELQSANEELSTANDEQSTRNQELTKANNDLLNLMNSVDLAIVLLDTELRIRRFTPPAQDVLNLIPQDIGRRFSDLKPNLKVEDLGSLVKAVFKNQADRQLNVRDLKGHWYSLRMRLYRNQERKVEGIVLVLVDIDADKANLDKAEGDRGQKKAG